MLTLGSLFDGIGGWQLAAIHAGVKPIWASEIEKFPIAVTKHHFPDTIQLGDITKIRGDEIPPVDIICAGSPCQDLSVAGKQEGLKGERSGLFRNAIDIVRRMRMSTGGRQPRYFVWENVPGAFSSNRGMDFRAVLEEIGQTEIPMPENNRWAESGLVQCKGAEIAWRVLDAQYWGVPQRRKRVFLVADFGGYSAGQILFEQQGLYGHIAESREKGKATPTGTQRSTGTAVFDMTHANNPVQSYTHDVCHTLTARMGTGGNQVPVVSYAIAGNTIDRQIQNGANGKGVLKEKSYTLNTVDRHAVMYTAGSFAGFQATEQCGSLKASGGDIGGGSESIVIDGEIQKHRELFYSIGHDERSAQFTPNKTDPLTASDYKQPPIVNAQKTVRRLTPLECERLQGLPDGYTLINDSSCRDSARYKALGNGMAQPCADYIIRRIVEVSENE